MIIEEQTVSSDKIYTGKVISLKVDTVEVPNKGYKKREIIEHPGAVAILAITEDKKVLLVKQFRKAIEKALWELPAGKLEQGESPKECAIRELKEETGYSANNVKLIHKFYTSAGFSNQKMYIYLATDLEKGKSNLDDDEFLDLYEIDLNKAYEMIDKNDIEDAKTSLGLLLIKQIL